MTEIEEPSMPAGEPFLLRALRRVSRTDWMLIASVLFAKFFLFSFGVRAFRMLEDKPVSGWLEIWNRWDSLIYQKLAKDGYTVDYVWKAWFYPLYPWSVRLVGRLCDDYLVGAFVVSGIASVAVVLLLYRVVRLDYSSGTAQRAVFFLLIFPTAYFLHIGYSESLFLALALGSILAARRDLWCLAGALGALAWTTRPTGIVLVPTLLVEAGYQYYLTRRWQRRWLWIALIPLGFGIYLFMNWRISGEPFAFLGMWQGLAAKSFAWPWVGLKEAIGNMQRSPSQGELVGTQEVFFALLGLICTIVSWFRLRPIYAAWMTSSWLLYTSVKFIQSGPRYALAMFPIFILFALAGRRRFWNLVITMWSLLFLALFVSLFVRGWWAF